MKTFLIIPLLFLFNVAHSQQVHLIDENFENGFPAGWIHYYAAWGGKDWAIDSAAGALRENRGPFFIPRTNRIELPAVNLTSVQDPVLAFDLAMAVTNPHIQFSLSYTTDSVWHPLLTYDDTSTDITIHNSFDNDWTPSDTGYQAVTVDLAQLGNKPDIRFGFVYDYLNAHASGVWYIDNVKLYGTSPNGIPISGQTEPFSFKLFPNPVTGIVRIIPNSGLSHATLKITDATGKPMLEQPINSGVEEIDVSGYPAGVYIVSCTHMNNTSVKKLIIR